MTKKVVLSFRTNMSAKGKNPKNINLEIVARAMLRNMFLSLKNNDNASCSIPIKNIMSSIGNRAFFFALLIFSFPLSLPLPYPPGLPTMFSLPIIFLSIQMIFGKRVLYLPKFIMQYEVRFSLLNSIIRKSQRILRFISKRSKQKRIGALLSDNMTRPYGLFVLIMALAIFIPFPGTNFLPSVAIFLISIGILILDGLVCLAGIIVGIIGFVIIYFFGKVILNFTNQIFAFFTIENIKHYGLYCAIIALTFFVSKYVIKYMRKRKMISR